MLDASGSATLVAALVTLGCAACAPTREDDRAAWLQHTLTLDHQDLIARDPDLVAGKYAKMARTPYEFFRGTLPQFVRDLGELSTSTTTSGGAGWSILLVGDPHPENIGTYRAGDARVWLDFNDFDASRPGPYHLDVWRLGQGFDVLLRQTPGVDDATRRRAVRAVASGYVAELTLLASGSYTAVDETAGTIVADLVRRAMRDGDQREELDDYTESSSDTPRRLVRGEQVERTDPRVIEEELWDPGQARVWIAEAVAHEWPSTLAHADTASVTVLDVARHLGAGVSSYPLERYYVLVDGPGDDDVLLEAKEIRDPPSLPGLPALPARQHANNAARVVDHARRLQLYPDDDPYLGWVSRGAFALRIRHRTKYQRGFDAARLADQWAAGDWTADDVVDFAESAGRLLARAHGRTPTLAGGAAVDTIRAAMGADFVEEAAQAAQQWGTTTLADYHSFLTLLDTQGPLLGARP